MGSSLNKQSVARSGRLLPVFATAYAVLVLGFTLALRYIGEATVPSTVALYLPRWPLGLPLPIFAAALAARRRWWAFGVTLLAGYCWLFPLLGLRAGTPRSPLAGRQLLRVLTFNTNSNEGSAPFIAGLRTANADLIVLQECAYEDAAFWQQRLPEYTWSVRAQFVLGSRFPITDVSRAYQHGAAYVSYRIQLPRGSVQLYSVHPPSPRLTMRQLLHSRAPFDLPRLTRVAQAIAVNTADRERQLGLIAAEARTSRLPVIIAGDTNLPDASPALARTFTGFTDAFTSVGRGFGYTFPANRGRLGPWMRIDRIFVSDAVRVLDCATLPPADSDHLPVLAVLEL